MSASDDETPQNLTSHGSSKAQTNQSRPQQAPLVTLKRDNPESTASVAQDTLSRTFAVEENGMTPLNEDPAHRNNQQEEKESPSGTTRRVRRRVEDNASQQLVEADRPTNSISNGIPNVNASIVPHHHQPLAENETSTGTATVPILDSSATSQVAEVRPREENDNNYSPKIAERVVNAAQSTNSNTNGVLNVHAQIPNYTGNAEAPTARTSVHRRIVRVRRAGQEEMNIGDYPPEIVEQVDRARRQFGLPPNAPFQVNRIGNVYQDVLRAGDGTMLRGNWPGPAGGSGRGNRIVVPIPINETLSRREQVIRDVPLDNTRQQHMIPAHASLRLVPGENGQLLLRIANGSTSAVNFFQNSFNNPRMVAIRAHRNGPEGRVAIHLETEEVMRQRNQVPPLEPVILPDSQQTISSSDTSQANPDTERFTCGICYEYMEMPSSCGQCSGRFCKECLIKVKQSQRGLCPICRKPIGDIQEDTELAKVMDEACSVPCRFEGCNASLSLRQVKQHEHSECQMVRVFCRYKEYGCPWKGRRCDLADHEERDCTLAKVSGLVDQVRTMAAERESIAREMAMRMSSLGLAVNHEREMTRRQTARSTSNPIDILSFVIQVTCCSPSLMQIRETWANLYATTNARAAVFNWITLAPTFLLVGRVIWREYSRFVFVLRHPQFSFDSIDEETAGVFIDSALGVAALTLVTLLMGFSLLFDNKSHEGWDFFAFPFASGPIPVMLYAITISSFLIYSLIFTLMDGVFLTGYLALVLFTATAVLPISIASLSCKLSRAASTPLGFSTGRVARPLLFGLRYAFVVHMTDAVSCFDALCLLHLLDGQFNLLTQSLGHKELFFDWPPLLDVFFVSIALGRGVREFLLDENDMKATANWGAAVVLILLVNMIVSRLATIFQWVGVYHYQVIEASPSDSIAGRKANAVGLGLLSLTVCSYMILATI
ncbi:hypothetical protein FisN_26Lh100 [Fistulifera solaris]|uniref:RING-type domain-containing protein n=1 Tax=Fistulifera solaris TaxID=1519565 RepID=A0A1Z5KCN3_FISSO|nr:hypothetical protein FisN_26Lh100 [Fistulifera solaris]|eukprot:GAX24029.1 hypothetical protein FisN_26Lh100 [Fistulifera solaris]